MSDVLGHICPICDSRMNNNLEAYADDSVFLPTETCPECGLSVVSSLLDTEENCQKVFNCAMARLLSQVAVGLRAQEFILANLQMLNNGDKLVTLMQSAVPPVVNHFANSSLSAMEKDDIRSVREVLGLT
jgi:hypothetical protein